VGWSRIDSRLIQSLNIAGVCFILYTVFDQIYYTFAASLRFDAGTNDKLIWDLR
jgi:hypothetical protein